MKLLILGAGSHGMNCREIAEAHYDNICFLDDFSNLAIGRLDEFEKHFNTFDAFFVALGNPQMRRDWLEKLERKGCKIATLISEKAVISKYALLGRGSVVFPGAVINGNATIQEGCIISAGAVIDHDSHVGKFCHINCNAVIASYALVPNETKIGYREIFS